MDLMFEAPRMAGNQLAAATPAHVSAAIQLMESRFGIPGRVFEVYAFVWTSRNFLSIVSADHVVPRRPPAESVGMPFLRTHLRFPKPTTAAILHFGGYATRNVVALSRNQAEEYLHRQAIIVKAGEADEWTSKGYVIVRHQDVVLGLGFFRDDPAPPVLTSLYPRAWSPGRNQLE